MTEPDYWMIRGEIWSSDIAFLEAHNGTSSEVQAAMDEWEHYAIPLYKSPSSNDKLEDHLLPYSKEMIQKIRDEKMQLVTAEEFVKLHKESLTAIRDNDKLQEQLNTAKKALTELEAISVYPVDKYDESCGYDWESAIKKAEKTAVDALAALEGGEENA